MSYPGHSLGVVLPLCREAVGAFYSPSRLGKLKVRCLKRSTVGWYQAVGVELPLTYKMAKTASTTSPPLLHKHPFMHPCCNTGYHKSKTASTWDPVASGSGGLCVWRYPMTNHTLDIRVPTCWPSRCLCVQSMKLRLINWATVKILVYEIDEQLLAIRLMNVTRNHWRIPTSKKLHTSSIELA